MKNFNVRNSVISSNRPCCASILRLFTMDTLARFLIHRILMAKHLKSYSILIFGLYIYRQSFARVYSDDVIFILTNLKACLFHVRVLNEPLHSGILLVYSLLLCYSIIRDNRYQINKLMFYFDPPESVFEGVNGGILLCPYPPN